MEKVVIYGAGALAIQIIAYNRRYNMFDIVGLVDDNENSFDYAPEIPLYSFEDFKHTYPADSQHVVPREGVRLLVSIGYTRCNTYREQAIQRLVDAGYKLTNFIAPGANCWPGSIDPESGVLVFDNAFIGVGCCLKKGVIISEGSVLSHDVTVEPFSFFSDGVVVGGHARIGCNSFIGLNSTIKSGCEIGRYNIIGSGANVLHNTVDKCVVKGNPGQAEIKETLEISI